MNKCLVFTLPRAISDATLPKMGILSARIELRNLTTIDSSYFVIRTNEACTATIIPDDGSLINFTNSMGEYLGLSVPLQVGANGLYASLGSGIIEVTNKESITGFSGLCIDVSELKYLPNLTYLDLRNNLVTDVSKRSYGDLSGVIDDYLVATNYCTNYNSVTYDVSRIPNDVSVFEGGISNPIGLYCSDQRRKGEGAIVVTNGQFGAIRFSKVKDARNFILSNAECKWSDRDYPHIRVRTLEDSLVNPFTNDAEVKNAIARLKDMGVTTFDINYFAV